MSARIADMCLPEVPPELVQPSKSGWSFDWSPSAPSEQLQHGSNQIGIVSCELDDGKSHVGVQMVCSVLNEADEQMRSSTPEMEEYNPSSARTRHSAALVESCKSDRFSVASCATEDQPIVDSPPQNMFVSTVRQDVEPPPVTLPKVWMYPVIRSNPTSSTSKPVRLCPQSNPNCSCLNSTMRVRETPRLNPTAPVFNAKSYSNFEEKRSDDPYTFNGPQLAASQPKLVPSQSSPTDRVRISTRSVSNPVSLVQPRPRRVVPTVQELYQHQMEQNAIIAARYHSLPRERSFQNFSRVSYGQLQPQSVWYNRVNHANTEPSVPRPAVMRQTQQTVTQQMASQQYYPYPKSYSAVVASH